MQYLAAYTLASLSGKQPTNDTLANILKATGQKFDEAEIAKVVKSLKGKKIEDLIKAGSSKVGSVGGSIAGNSAPKTSEKVEKAEKTEKAPKKQQPKKEVKKEEPKVEEEEDFGGADLFGGDF